MKKFIINKCMNYIRKNNSYSKTELEEIRYGLTSIYMNASKLIFIFSISLILGFFKETIIFLLLFNFLRMFAFGLHATKSWVCWITSTIAFLIIPYIGTLIIINKYIIQLICLICVLLIYKNSPADTKKRPIVSQKRRTIYNIIATIFSIAYSICAITLKNNFVVNCLVFSMILENILISPVTYRLFKLPYNNYIDFLKKHPDFTY